MRTNNHHEGQCTHCPGHNCSNGEQLMNERRMLAHGQKESTREWEEEKVERKKNRKRERNTFKYIRIYRPKSIGYLIKPTPCNGVQNSERYAKRIKSEFMWLLKSK